MTYPSGDTDGEGVATDGGRPTAAQSGGSSSLPIKRGAVVGAVAYVATFVLTYVLAQIETEGELAGGAGQYEGYEIAGWMMYNAHNVDISASSAGQSASQNFLELAYSAGSQTVPKLVFYAVPVVVLVVAGTRVARSASTDPTESAKAAATVGVGYVGLGIAGAFTVFSKSVTQSGFGRSVTLTIEPKLGATVLFFAAYAVIAGGIGGYVASQ